MNYILSYPRSGQNLLAHMIGCLGIRVEKTHRFTIWDQWPPKPGDILILIIRDYRECIPRHLFPNEPVTTEMITKLFGREYGLRDRVAQYLENIVLYDVYPESKYSIYYEDLIQGGKIVFERLAYWLGSGKDEIDALEWDREFQKSLSNYKHPKLSGGKIDFHKKRIQDIPLLEKLMRKTNPYIFDKYLKRYHEQDV